MFGDGRDPVNHLDNLIMEDLISLAEKLTDLASFTDEILKELKAARENISEETWEDMLDGPFGSLICSTIDLEDFLEN